MLVKTKCLLLDTRETPTFSAQRASASSLPSAALTSSGSAHLAHSGGACCFGLGMCRKIVFELAPATNLRLSGK